MQMKIIALGLTILSLVVLPQSAFATTERDDGLYVMEDVDLSSPVIDSVMFEAMISGGGSVKAAKATCGPYAGLGVPLVWRTYQWINCSLAGHVGYQKTYNWWVMAGSSSQACSQGMGYNADIKVIWRNIGCGSRGSVKVPWGNVISYPKYKTISTSAPLMAPTYWQ